MPQAIPIILTAAFTAGGALVAGATLTTALLIGGLSLALGFINQALVEEPDAIGQDDISARTLSVRSTTEPRKLVYGESRAGGVIAHVESTNDDLYLHIVYMFASHEISEFLHYMIDDDFILRSDIDGNGDVVSGKYAGHIRIKEHLGTDTQAADVDLVAETAGWSSGHNLYGIAYSYVRLKSNRDLFTGGVPNITCVLRGKKVFDPRDSSTKWTPNAVLCLRDYFLDTRYGVAADVSEIDDTQVIAGANVCDEFVDTQQVDQGIQSVDTVNNTLQVGLNQALRVQFGDRVEVATSGTPPAPLAVSTPYYVCPIDSQVTPRVKLATTYQNLIDGVFIDITSAGTGSNVIRKTGEPRYTCNGILSTGQTYHGNILRVLGGMAGTASYVGGTWKFIPGAFTSATRTLDERDVRGPFVVQTKESRRSRFNRVTGLYISPLNNYQGTDYPLVKNATYLAEDNNKEALKRLDLAVTSRASTAQRIAKIFLERHRQMIRTQFSAKLRVAYNLEVGDNVFIDNVVHGFNQKIFEVQEWKWALEQDPDGAPLYAASLGLRETAAGVFSWALGNETLVDLAPNTTLPSFVPLAPTNLQLFSGDAELILAADGTVISRIRAAWTGSPSVLLTSYEIQWKKSTDSVWRNQVSVSNVETEAYLAPVEDGVNYDVQVRAKNESFSSDWVPELAHTVVGKLAPPSEPDSFNISILPDGTRVFKWTHVDQPADVRSGGGYEIRYKLGATSDWATMIPLHERTLNASPWESNDPAAGTYTFAIKTIDSSDNESTLALFVSNVILGNPRIENALLQRNEASFNWPGTLVSCFHDPIRNILIAESNQTWANLPTAWSSLSTSWDTLLTNKTPIEYTSPTIDLGRDFTFRPLITPTAEGTPTVSFQFGTDADGAPVGAFIEPQVVVGRYVKIKCSVTGTSAKLSGLTTIIDAPGQVETFDDVDTSSATFPEFESIVAGHFKVKTLGGISAITQAHIQAIQNVGAGFTWELISKNAGFGSNLVLNGTFATDLTNWTDRDTGTGVSSWVSGRMRLVGVDASNAAIRDQQISGLTIGNRYQIRFDVFTANVGLQIDGDTFNDAAHAGPVEYAPGSHIVEFIAVETTAGLVFYNLSPTNAELDNVTFRDGTPTAEFKVYNSSSVLADATVDILLRGART